MTPREQALLELVRECREFLRRFYAIEPQTAEPLIARIDAAFVSDAAEKPLPPEKPFWTVLFNNALGEHRLLAFCYSEEAAGLLYLLLSKHKRVPTKRPYHKGDLALALSERAGAAPASVSPQAPTAPMRVEFSSDEDGLCEGPTAAGADWVPVPRKVVDDLGMWLSAAMDDNAVCEEMKSAISAWLDATHESAAPRPDAGEGMVDTALRFSEFVERHASYPDDAVIAHSCHADMIRMKHIREAARALGRGEGKL